MRIGIGTVQFGLSYGISNSLGQTPPAEVEEILRQADLAGIRVLDTAPAYGESEMALGAALRRIGTKSSWRVVTKGPALAFRQVTPEVIEAYRSTLASSIAKLEPAPIDAFLLHRAEHLFLPGAELLVQELLRWKSEGKIRRLGISAYQEREVQQAQNILDLDLIQVPFSLFDQRLLRSGALARWKQKGLEVHARSVFLQGLLFLDAQQVPPHLQSALPALKSLDEYCQTQRCSRLEAALAFALSISELDQLILGISSSEQLREILAASQTKWHGNAEDFALLEEKILNPALWKS